MRESASFNYVNAAGATRVQTGTMSTSSSAKAADRDEPDAVFPSLDPQTVRLWRALEPLDLAARRALLSSGRITTHCAKSSLVLEDQVAVVLNGRLAIQSAPGELTVALAGPGQIIAFGAAQPPGTWITDGELYGTSLASWIGLGGTAAARHLILAAAQAHTALRRQIACIARHQATPRLADLLRVVNDKGDGQRIPLSQEEIGLMLGLRRTTVNASSKALQTAGCLRTLRGQVRIVDAARLDAFACGCRIHGPSGRATGGGFD